MNVTFKNIYFQLLLGGLFLYLTLSPFLLQYPYAFVTINFLLTSVFLAAIFTLQRKKALKVVSIIVLCATLIPYWLNLLGLINISLTFNYLLFVIYLSIIVCSMLVRIVRAKKVSANVIYAALCSYLLTGILWGVIYTFIDIQAPGSFKGWIFDLPDIPEMRFHGFIYFSFTTLTTLGYGDMVPQTLQAAAFCEVEAIMGQFFISVLIAHLVGLHITQRISKEESWKRPS